MISSTIQVSILILLIALVIATVKIDEKEDLTIHPQYKKVINFRGRKIRVDGPTAHEYLGDLKPKNETGILNRPTEKYLHHILHQTSNA